MSEVKSVVQPETPAYLPSKIRGLARNILHRAPAADQEAEVYTEPWHRKLLRILLPGGVSRVHLYEARERYLSLLRQLESERSASKASVVDDQKQRAIEESLKVLRKTEALLTRRQSDLNLLWRELTRIHITLIEKVLPDDQLPYLIFFCREEAYRLNLTQDPDVNELLQRLAEVTQDRDIPTHKDRMIRNARALIERFTSIRTGRIHQQFINIRTYQRALLVLVPILYLLIANVDTVTLQPSDVAPTEFAFEPALGVPIPVVNEAWQWAQFVAAYIGHSLKHNILFFVFLGGLTGGLLSVVFRLRDRHLIPGEDAYFAWYVLTKPFVGALGAIVLFILLQAKVIESEVFTQFIAGITASEPSPLVFGFSFLAGFSERIVFPSFR